MGAELEPALQVFFIKLGHIFQQKTLESNMNPIILLLQCIVAWVIQKVRARIKSSHLTMFGTLWRRTIYRYYTAHYPNVWEHSDWVSKHVLPTLDA